MNMILKAEISIATKYNSIYYPIFTNIVRSIMILHYIIYV